MQLVKHPPPPSPLSSYHPTKAEDYGTCRLIEYKKYSTELTVIKDSSRLVLKTTFEKNLHYAYVSDGENLLQTYLNIRKIYFSLFVTTF